LILEELLGIAQGAAAGMLHLHQLGIVHRDLCANNIIIDGDRNGNQ